MEAMEVYKELEEQAIRLSNGEPKGISLDDILREFVLPQVSTKEQIELTRMLQRKKDPNREKIFENIRALKEAIKILALMEASDNLEEFKNLSGKHKRPKEKPYELTDFDKLLKAIASVPKPTGKQMKEYLKNRPKDIDEEIKTTDKKAEKKKKKL